MSEPSGVNKRRTKLRLKRFGYGILVCLLLATSGWAQGTTGSIEGTVTDQSGAAVPGAEVKAKNTATGAEHTASADETGFFRFPLLPSGTYEVAVEKSGFAKFLQKNVPVTVGGKINLEVTLTVATQASTVTVVEESPLIEFTRTHVSNTVNDRAVSDLPINGRNFLDFVLLTPGVTRDVRGGDISFAGQRGTLNSLTVDGSDNNNTFFGQSLGRAGVRNPYQFSQDAVKEFQVNSNAYSAEFGRAGGAVINVITKSGTNDFHGTAFWFYRDRSLNARDLISSNANRAKAAYHFNQFGGNVGGPIIKEKLFFFFDYDAQRNKLAQITFLQLPTGFAPATTFETQALAYLTGRLGTYLRTTDNDVYLLKGDWVINNSNTLNVRWNRGRFTGGNGESSGNQVAEEHSGGSLVNTDSLTSSLTTTLSPTQINVVRLSWQKDKEPGLANSDLPEAVVRQAGATVFTVGRNFFSPRETTIDRWQFADTFTWISGRHTMKFGFDFVRDDILNFFPGNFSGSYTFASLEDFGRSLTPTAGFPVSSGSSFTQAFAGAGTTGPRTFPDIREYSGFAQDEWRVADNVTLTLGLRYDVQSVAQPPVLNPAPGLVNAGIRTDFINRDSNNFGPRFGVAWNPFDSKKLVIRGGYGMFYGRTPSIMVGTAHSNNGINVSPLTFTPSTNPVMPSYPNTICGAPVPAPSCSAPTTVAGAAPDIFVFERDYQQPRVQQINAGFEYELWPNWAVTATYLGVKGSNIQRSRDINTPSAIAVGTVGIQGTTTFLPLQYFAASITNGRPIAGVQRIAQFEGSSNTIYHGGTLQVNKRMAKNYQFSAAYTYSKIIDDNPDATAVVPRGSDDAKMIYNPAVPIQDRALGNNDQRHRMVISGIWQLNYANGFSPIAKAIFGGWELSAIFAAEQGLPFTALVNSDLNNDSNSRNERVPGTGRNTFRHPKTVTLDPRVTKNIQFHERAKLQLILEAFNVFNRANIGPTNISPVALNNTQYSFSTSAATCGAAFGVVRAGAAAAGGTSGCLVPNTAFGTPTAVRDPRIVQLAAKIVF